MALINYITQIQFEFGAIDLLKQQCERVGIRRPLIVTDRGVKAAGIIDTVLDALAHAGTVALYDGTPPNPNEAAVREAVDAYRKGDCDGIIAVGGGSSIDLAKGVAVCATHDGPLQSFAVIEGGLDRITARTAPVIAVPTTAGTALDGLWRGWRHIERATRQGDDRDARLNMMSASMQGALAFQKGLGCVHSLSHSLGGIDARLHHGTLNAIFLPAVIAFNQAAASVREEDKLARMAQAMGLASGAEVGPSVRAMTERLGLPTGLAQLGVTRAMFPDIVRGALKDHSHRTNPRVASDTDYEAMLEASM